MIRRHPRLGHLCGYVVIPKSHPWHGKDYDEIDDKVQVHGGITYGQFEKDYGNEYRIGFDCAHLGDLVPTDLLIASSLARGEYRDIGYVTAECESLARQVLGAAE